MKKLRNLKSAICESGHIQTSVLDSLASIASQKVIDFLK